MGQGFGGFLGLRERSSSYINARGAACPSQVEFFIKYVAVITFVSACTSEIGVEKQDNIIAINKLVSIIY